MTKKTKYIITAAVSSAAVVLLAGAAAIGINRTHQSTATPSDADIILETAYNAGGTAVYGVADITNEEDEKEVAASGAAETEAASTGGKAEDNITPESDADGSGVSSAGSADTKDKDDGSPSVSSSNNNSTGENKSASGENTGKSGSGGNNDSSSGNNGGSGSGNNASSGSGNSSSGTAPDPEPVSGNESSCSHVWVETIELVSHEEVGHYEEVMVCDAWDEDVYETHTLCGKCGYDYTANGKQGGDYHGNNNCAGTWGSKIVKVGTVHHDAVYETQWIVDQAAYTEQVVTGYECLKCGATK